METNQTHNQSYSQLKTALLPPHTPTPLTEPQSKHHQALTSQIAALQLHPTLESLLHILNGDLWTAHFLVRHMQAPVLESAGAATTNGRASGVDGVSIRPGCPRTEGMLLHAVLHRIEGDYENAMAWYRDVAGAEAGDGSSAHGDEEIGMGLFGYVWAVDRGGLDGALVFVRELRDYVKGGRAGNSSEDDETQDEKKKLEVESEREITALLKWCEARYGTERWNDASSELRSHSEKTREIAKSQVVGGEGWRKF